MIKFIKDLITLAIIIAVLGVFFLFACSVEVFKLNGTVQAVGLFVFLSLIFGMFRR